MQTLAARQWRWGWAHSQGSALQSAPWKPFSFSFFFKLSILSHRAPVLALLQPSGDFQLLQKGCCAVCLPTLRFPGLSGLLLSNTMSSLVLGVLRNIDLSNSCTWPLSIKLGTEQISLSPTVSPGAPLIVWET